MNKITAIIPTYNEAHNIAAAIETVSWCDEIIVVDSFSKDETIEIAKSKGAKVLSHEYEHSAAQKNWVIPQAKHEWILLLDADERMSPKLNAEIQKMLQENSMKFDAYWIRRENHFLGKKINYSGWQNDKVIRFFKRDTCKYEDKKVHAEVITSGGISILKNRIVHYTYKDFNHYMEKVHRYTTLSAKDHASKTGKVTLYHLLIKPFARFVKHYIFNLGILDGKEGFIISRLSAYSIFLRYVKLSRIQKGEKM